MMADDAKRLKELESENVELKRLLAEAELDAWIESFKGRLRDELLNGWQFDSLLEAKILIEDWRIDYNSNRPHSPLNDSPQQFATAWTNQLQPA